MVHKPEALGEWAKERYISTRQAGEKTVDQQPQIPLHELIAALNEPDPRKGLLRIIAHVKFPDTATEADVTRVWNGCCKMIAPYRDDCRGEVAATREHINRVRARLRNKARA